MARRVARWIFAVALPCAIAQHSTPHRTHAHAFRHRAAVHRRVARVSDLVDSELRNAAVAEAAAAAALKTLDCAAIGMGAPNAPCDLELAKVMNHLQFPSRAAESCPRFTTLPTGNLLWGGGFGGDSAYILPELIMGAIDSGRGVNVVGSRCRQTWMFNDPTHHSSLCAGKTWYECYFKPHTSCATPAACTTATPTATSNFYNELADFAEDQLYSGAGGFEEARWTSKFFSPTRLAKLREYTHTHHPLCVAAPAAAAAAAAASRPPSRSRASPPTSPPPPPAAALAALRKRVAALHRNRKAESAPFMRLLQLHAAALFFRPNAMLRAKLDAMKARLAWVEGGMVGIQIRHTDMVAEQPEISLASYCHAAATMMAHSGHTHVFVATDDRTITAERFAACIVAVARDAQITTRARGAPLPPPIVVMQSWARSDGSTHEQMANAGASSFGLAAIVDIFLLAECSGVAISEHSSFSTLALMLALINGVQMFDVVHCNHAFFSTRDEFERVPGVRNTLPRSDESAWRKRCARDKKHVVIADDRCDLTATSRALHARLERRISSRAAFHSPCVDVGKKTFVGLSRYETCEALCGGGSSAFCTFVVPIHYAGMLTGKEEGWMEKPISGGGSGGVQCQSIHFATRLDCAIFTTTRYCVAHPSKCHGAKALVDSTTPLDCSIFVATVDSKLAPLGSLHAVEKKKTKMTMTKKMKKANGSGSAQCTVAMPDVVGFVGASVLKAGRIFLDRGDDWTACRDACAEHGLCAAFTVQGTACTLWKADGGKTMKKLRFEVLGAGGGAKRSQSLWEVLPRSETRMTTMTTRRSSSTSWGAVMPPSAYVAPNL